MDMKAKASSLKVTYQWELAALRAKHVSLFVRVSTEHYWVPVTDDTPVGAKMLVIDDKQRIAYLRDYQPNQGWTHVFPLPRFKDMK